MFKEKIIAIVGQTASGKSELGIKLARMFNGEIISADSRQVYKGLSIGTAKISKKEMHGVKHHCLDLADPKKTFTVVDFKKCAETAIGEISKKGKVPIVVGGTGFYVDSIIYESGYPRVPPDWQLRKKLVKKSTGALLKKLKVLDPKRARVIDPDNKRRLIRALEIVLKTGKKVPPQYFKLRPNVLILGIKKSSKKLKQAIKQRTETMLKRGLIREAKSVLKKRLNKKRLGELGFEYTYPLLYLERKMPREKMVGGINTQTWHYARRQMTWFRRNQKIEWIVNFKEAQRKVKNFLAKGQ